MNEIILFIIVIIVLVGSQFLLKGIKAPTIHYVRIFAAVVLLLLIWLSKHNGTTPIKIIISSVVVSYAIKEIYLIRRTK